MISNHKTEHSPQKNDDCTYTVGGAATDKSNRLQTIDKTRIRESIIKKNAYPLKRREGVFFCYKTYTLFDFCVNGHGVTLSYLPHLFFGFTQDFGYSGCLVFYVSRIIGSAS